MTDIYVARFSAWASGIENADEWNEWALGKRQLCLSGESPAITFTDPMFRRRLSQISKMTIQVVHDLLPVDEDTKMIFLSIRGELSKQYIINRMVIEEKAVMPAAFSFSVFNTPIALASMAFNLKGGYSALYQEQNSFSSGLAAACAALLAGVKDELIVVYADEAVPQEYAAIYKGSRGNKANQADAAPLAFGLLLTRKPASGAICFSSLFSSLNKETDTPRDFLKQLLLQNPGIAPGIETGCFIPAQRQGCRD